MRALLALLLCLLLATPAWAGVNPIGTDGTGVKVSTSQNAMRVTSYPRGTGVNIAATTGTIAAALAANSAVFCARLDPGSTGNAYITNMRLDFTTIVAFTTAVTAGRRLAVFRGSGAACSGGTASPALLDDSTTTSEFNTAQGGDTRVASTGALTVTGITFETDPVAICTLAHVGAAGGFYSCEPISKDDALGHPLVIRPGQVLAIRNPVAMDAAGTWQLGITISGVEE